MRTRLLCLVPLVLAPSLAALPATPAPRAPQRVTILYDAFGGGKGLTRDWGFAALVEYGGKRILFDTGNDAGIFARNTRALGVDLQHLDFVVISHRHGDHTSGLSYLLARNPHVVIYAPRERFGVFGSEVPADFYRSDPSLPDSLRYYGGEPPQARRSGTPWPGADFRWIDTLTEVAPGVAVVATVSRTPGTVELRELSLALRTPEGLVLVVGCSHPGIETILTASRAYDPHLHAIFGGLHLVSAPDSVVARVGAALHDVWRVDLVAPGHCTGEPAFADLRRRYGARYRYAGLGTVTSLP